MIVLGVDANPPLRRVKLRFAQFAQQKVGIVGASAAQRSGGQMHLEVSGLGAGRDGSVLAEPLLVVADKAFGGGRGQCLEEGRPVM